MADDETEAREALARMIAAEFHDEIPDNPEDDARMDFPWRSTYEGIAVRIIADGWQHVPPDHVVVPTSGEFRLLRAGEAIEVGDQPLLDDCQAWGELDGWEVGMIYDPMALVPIRRAAISQERRDAE